MFNESDDRETNRNKSHAEEIRVRYNCSPESDKLGRLVLLRLLHTYGCTIYVDSEKDIQVSLFVYRTLCSRNLIRFIGKAIKAYKLAVCIVCSPLYRQSCSKPQRSINSSEWASLNLEISDPKLFQQRKCLVILTGKKGRKRVGSCYVNKTESSIISEASCDKFAFESPERSWPLTPDGSTSLKRDLFVSL